jgi:hypothetical protein
MGYKNNKEIRNEIHKTGTKGFSLLDKRRDEDILDEFKVDPMKRNQHNINKEWLNHVSRLEDIRYPEHLLEYRPIER